MQEAVEGNSALPDTQFLHGLRAIAALWVLGAHCMIWSHWQGAIPNAKLAVDLFIILSGFLMMHVVTQRWAAEPLDRPRSWAVFFVRRFFRLAPAYYLSLGVAVAISAWWFDGISYMADRHEWLRESRYNGRSTTYDAANLAAHITFVFGLLPRWSSSTLLPDWSLGLEMQFYAVFPALFLLARRFGMVIVAIACAAVSVYAILRIGVDRFPEPSFLPFKLPIFLVGMLLFEASRVRSVHQRVCMSGLALLLTATQVAYYGYGTLWLTAIAGSVAWVAVPENVGANHLKRALSSRIAVIGSELSYSVYLFHGFFIGIVGAALFRAAWFAPLSPGQQLLIYFSCVLSGTLVVAAIVRSTVERAGLAAGAAATAAIRKPLQILPAAAR
jgi:peptidoglycan/LPS O-acetylase OafA/YrhL